MCRLRRFLHKHIQRACVDMIAGTRTKPPSGIVRGTLPNAVTLALGRNLRYFREQAGLTQVELAFDAEVERSRISQDRTRTHQPFAVDAGHAVLLLEDHAPHSLRRHERDAGALVEGRRIATLQPSDSWCFA